MILFFYNLALVGVLLVGAPWWLWRIASTRKYREGLWERLGAVPNRLKAAQRPVIWLHAVSVGEALAVSRLVAELDARLPEFRVMISTTTMTGQALARERFGAARVFYCPLDLPWAVSAYLKALKPAMLVLAETEFWPNLLSQCFARDVPVVVVNARISDRSWKRGARFRRLWWPFLGKLTLVLTQTATDWERLWLMGAQSERTWTLGNLKFDVRAAMEAEATRRLRRVQGDLRLLVAGSTVEGEEEMLLAAWPGLLAVEAKLAMVVAPRHAERFGVVEGLLAKSGLAWRKRSAMTADSAGLASGEIVLLDSIGELASVYSLASVAFVGGSLVARGGHNPLEPAQFGVPVVIGTHYDNFRAIVQELREERAIAVVSAGDLQTTLAALLADNQAAKAMGERGRAAFEQRGGVTEKTVDQIAAILAQRAEA